MQLGVGHESLCIHQTTLDNCSHLSLAQPSWAGLGPEGQGSNQSLAANLGQASERGVGADLDVVALAELARRGYDSEAIQNRGRGAGGGTGPMLLLSIQVRGTMTKPDRLQ